MRVRISYTNYPLSQELTQKSKNVATYTQWYTGLVFASIPVLISVFLLPSLIVPAMLIAFVCAIVFPILLGRYRKRKFAEYDAEYQKILQAQGK